MDGSGGCWRGRRRAAPFGRIKSEPLVPVISRSVRERVTESRADGCRVGGGGVGGEGGVGQTGRE